MDKSIHSLKGCCCECEFRVPVYHHCSTSAELRKKIGRCCCNVIKGYACVPPVKPVRVYDNWSEHGSCELFMKKEKCNE